MIEDKYEKLEADSFEFVHLEKKIYDKKFETKPIGYFKDAFIRFSKNKTNVIATCILFFIIFCSVFIPIVSTKNYTRLEEQLSHLPPRVPILENYGFLDGTRTKSQPVDLSTIDPETGLGLPLYDSEEFIIMDTLENYTKGCTDKEELCVGGESVLRLDPDSNHVTIVSTDFLVFNSENNPYLMIDIADISKDYNTALNIYLKPTSSSEYELVKSITTLGKNKIFPLDELGVSETVRSKIKLELVSDNDRNIVILNSIEVFDNSQTEPIFSDSGYDLSLYKIESSEETGNGAGKYVRQNGERLIASYRFRSYDAAFSDKLVRAFSANEYDEIMTEFGDKCTSIPDPDNPEGWIFPDTCPIIKVIKQNDIINVGGEDCFSYKLIINYGKYAGYDDIPYFLFGTTAAGHDLFTLIWVATRTSLLVGLIVATINIIVGVIYGAISGYYGGTTDIIMQRFAEVIGRVPWIVTLSIFVALLGPGIHTLILILIVSGWIGVSYITRTQFYRYKGREYVLASRTLGANDSRLIFRHILPNGIGTIITSSILMIPYVIFSESTISYLGFGIGHGQSFEIFGLKLSGVSVGVLLSDGRTELLDKPYLTIFPAIIISILMITFNMFGNALRDAFNPALRGSE